MSRTIYELRTARKVHACTERSYHAIKPGDRYLYGVCPPEHGANRTRKGEKRYEVIKACLRCAKEYGMLNSDMQKELDGAEASNRSGGPSACQAD